MQPYRLFLDLDGVLADFDRGVLELTGRLPRDLAPASMWPRIARADAFYENLHWMRDGHDLWEFARPLDPIILTGLPRGNWAEAQKRAWCRRELGTDVEVITCMTREKAVLARERTPEGTVPVLVDDRDRIRDQFCAMGGVFILHTSAVESIAALRQTVLPPANG